MKILETIKDILCTESNAITKIPVTKDYEQAVNAIIERVHKKGGKLVASGMGKAGHVAVNIAATLSSTGIPSIYIHPSEAQHGDIGMLQPNDILLVISNSGKTREILDIIAIAHNLYPQIPVIAITGNPDSELASKVDYLLLTGNASEVCPLGYAPTTSITLMSVIGDILVVCTMKGIGFTKEEYAKRHNGGSLGQKSREKK